MLRRGHTGVGYVLIRTHSVKPDTRGEHHATMKADSFMQL